MLPRAVLTVAVLALLLSGCAHRRRTKAIPPPSPPNAAPPVIGSVETGIASWYGKPYDGRRAADGEIYDMETLVAAHRTLPFNTWVRVFNLQNNRSIDVRIIDRGPFVDGRIIDLSHAAAQAVDMIGSGIARVRVQIISAPPAEASTTFVVQIGAYLDRPKADAERALMQSRYGSARVALEKGYWRVFVGAGTTLDGASSLASRIRRDFPEKKDAFVVRIESGAT
jgi:rare lipoprotein A